MSKTSIRFVLKASILGIIVIPFITGVIGFWLSLRHQRQANAERMHCVGNLVHIRLAKATIQKDYKLANGNSIPDNALDKYLLEYCGKPITYYRCPSGGTYVVGALGVTPRCTYTNYTTHFNMVTFNMERRILTHSLDP